jgi:hypothetical protein
MIPLSVPLVVYLTIALLIIVCLWISAQNEE